MDRLLIHIPIKVVLMCPLHKTTDVDYAKRPQLMLQEENMAENAPKLTTDQLNPGDVVTLTGKVAFSRIANRIEGEELARDIEAAKKRGQFNPIDKPYWKLALKEVSLIPQSGQATNLTLAEQYIANQRVFQSTTHPEYGNQYTATSKSPYRPQVFDGTQNPAPEIILDGELDTDLTVVIQMEVFGMPQGHNGIGLKQVIVMEPVRYWQPKTEMLSNLGLTLNSMSNQERERSYAEKGLDGNGIPAQNQPQTTAAPVVAPVVEDDPMAQVQIVPPAVADNPFIAQQTGAVSQTQAGIRYNPEG